MSWDRFRKAFEELAREEEGAEPDQRLCAWRDYSNPPAILDEKGKPRQRPLCVIRAPENGLWILDAGVNKTFQERFRTHGARAGRVLGARRGTDAEGVWLHRLYSYVSENHGEFIAPKIGGRTSAFRHMDRILYVCEASAIYCAWLERQALEHSEPRNRTRVDHRRTGGKRAESSRAQNSDKTAQDVESRTTTAGASNELESSKQAKKAPRQLALTERRAKAVSKVLRELRTVQPKMDNESHYSKLEHEHANYLIFKYAQQDSDVRRWIENVQERRDLVALAQEIAARHFKLSPATIATDWSHRWKPRRSPK